MKISHMILLAMHACTTDYKLRHHVEIDSTVAETETEADFWPDDTVIEDTPPGIEEPDIEIEFVPNGPLAVRPGCTSSGKFYIRNVGTADLVINQLDAYASVPADAQITSNYVPLPITIEPGGISEVGFDINQSDAVEDKVIVVAKSNDPDEPIAYADATYASDPGPLSIENFTIEENKAADVLMVVDNSCSMSEEQSELASNAELFIDSLNSSGVDYRIAVITTDQYTFVGSVITPYITDPAAELSSQVNVGTSGYPDEMGILMASKALGPGGPAAPGGSFLRSDARLSIVWISDEDDFSGGTTYVWSSDFWSKKVSPGDVSVWGIIGDPLYGCITADPGNIYSSLISAMGGGWSSICSHDWGVPMASVAGRVGIDSTLELSGSPIPSSIEVFVDGIRTVNWVYVVSTNAVSFNPGHIPPVGARIKIQYSTSGECS